MLRAARSPALRRAALAALALIAAALPVLSCGKPAPPSSPAEVLAVRRATLPAGPEDPAWRTAPMHAAALLLQDLVEPRLLQPSTSEVRVQAITDGTAIAFRLDWDDPTHDDLPGTSRFPDACAVQLPVGAGPDLPAPQMGEPGRGVEIAFWRASWQASADGRPDDIRAIHPGATVDHYPFEAGSLPEDSPQRREMADRYAPARALGNIMEGPRENPVEDLLAEGPGTIHPAPETRSRGAGRRGEAGWSVVISRPLPGGLAAGGRSQVAFAVWEGSRDEVGARKMRTAWVPLSVEAAR